MTSGGEYAESAGEATYTVSVAAHLAGMHAQTLRQYDRIGLVTPLRSKGRGRRYTPADIERLREVQQLTQEQGVNLAGVLRIMELEDEVNELRERLSELREHAHRLRAATPGVFTADSSGSVQFRPRPAESLAEEGPTAVSVRPTPAAPMPPQAQAAVKLARQGHTTVSQRGLVGWKLLAGLGLQRRMALKDRAPE